MSGKDSPFTQILEQATSEFTQFAAQLPKGAIGLYPKNMEGFLMRLISFNVMKKYFVELTDAESWSPKAPTGCVVAFTPNHPDYLKRILDKFSAAAEYQKHVLIMPRYGERCRNVVKTSGLDGQLNIVEFHADMVPVEPYEFLVPAPETFKRLYIDGDIDDLFLIARSIVKIEILHGMFPEVVTFGDNSERIAHLIQEMKAQIGLGAFQAHPTFHKIIVLDRIVDNMTPLLTQFTYNGVLDETLNPSYGVLNLPEDVKSENRQIIVSDADLAFKDIRGLKLPDANAFIAKCNEEMNKITHGEVLKKGMEMAKFKVQALRAKSLADRKPFFALHLEIMSHLTLAKANDELFNEAISFELDSILGFEPPLDLANRLMRYDEHWSEALRLYCIASQSCGGLPGNIIIPFRNKLIARFGLSFVKYLEQMEKIGLLTQQRTLLFVPIPNQFSFRNTASLFNLLPKNTDEEVVKQFNETDIGSFYDGYIPLTARLVQHATDGPITKSSMLKMFDSLNIKYKVKTVVDQPFAEEPDVKKILVFIIGGMTYSESIAIRELGNRIYQGAVEYYIGSTSIISANRFLKEMCPILPD